MALDDDKLEALRSWGERLQEASGEERSAAGRAILMLIEDIDRLRNELSRARWQLSEQHPVDPVRSDEPAEAAEEPASTLNDRLQRVLRRDSDPSSPQSWIDSLRRQK
jgi:hypothetical protein